MLPRDIFKEYCRLYRVGDEEVREFLQRLTMEEISQLRAQLEAIKAIMDERDARSSIY